MFVCICHGVTDSQIAAEVACGASSVADVADRTLAGTGCGMCQYKIENVLSACSAVPTLAGAHR